AHGRVGASLLDGNLRFTGGIELGAAHVGAPECRDGMSCGAVFTRNAQLLPIDNWTFLFGGDVGISTLQGALGLFFRVNYFPGVNPSFNVVDGERLNFGLSLPEVQVGLAVDLVSIYNLIAGNRSSATASSRPQDSSPSSSHPPEGAATTGGTAAGT